MKLVILLATGLFLLVNCKPNDKATANSDPKTEISSKTVNFKYKLTPFSSSQEYNSAAITNMAYSNGQFNFTLNESSYQLGQQTPDAPQKMCANSAKGQHIHLIIDNEPYLAKYTSDFDHDVSDGDHFLLSFLSRSYHESIKSDNAYSAVKATIKDNSLKNMSDIEDPMVFYSRPKGTYVGADTKKVMLDYYLINEARNSEFKVKANINGEVQTLDKWQPYYIEGLPMGENTIELTLIDKDGKTVETPLNPVKRTFTLKADPLENNG